MLTISTRLFPLWAILFSLLAWWQPHWFSGAKMAILPLLALIMFAMGLTLTLADFRRVLEMPSAVIVGTVLQFTSMPLLAWLIAVLLGLEPLLMAGLILVGACSGGTASNVITYLAGGNVALSITLTAVSTLLAVVMTPWLSWLYIDAAIDVPVWSMLKSILLLVIFPVALGVACNQWVPALTRQVQRFCPFIAVAAIVAIIAIVIALNQARMAEMTVMLLCAVILHNLCGLLLGYGVSRWLGFSEQTARTVAIEVGMQNSGLAVALAMKYFMPLAALPGALFSIWHNISGALLAAFWQRNNKSRGLP